MAQFEPFEKSGFTQEMISGAKDFYFSEAWLSNSNKVLFQLWTVVEGAVYVEESPVVPLNATAAGDALSTHYVERMQQWINTIH